MPRVWVFWVHASSVTRFEESFRSIAESLRIPERHEANVDIFLLVRTWLSGQEIGSWVMVLDNADDERMILGPGGNKTDRSENSVPLSQHLPTSTHGLILVTTRSRNVAQGLVGYDADIIALGPMDSTNAVQLLEKKFCGATIKYTINELTRLAQELD